LNLAACGGTFLTGLIRQKYGGLIRLTRPPRLSESDGGQVRFSYILNIQNIQSILSKKKKIPAINLTVRF